MQKIILSIVSTVLLINPIVLWLLTGSIWLSVVMTIVSIIVTYLIQTKGSSIRLSVWWFNILAIICICYSSEVVFRYLFPDKIIPNLYSVKKHYYFNKANLIQNFESEEYHSLYMTNSQGLRIPSLSFTDKMITTCDWLFIGDSFTQGAQVQYDELYSSIIAKQHPDKVIVNAGISGAGMSELFHYLQSEGLSLRPKKVFLQIGVFNDFTNVVEHTATFSEWLMEKSSLFRFIISNLLDTSELPLGRWCEPFRPDKKGNIDDNILYKESSSKKEFDKESFVKYINKINVLCKEHKAELNIILLPSKEQVSQTALNEVMSAFNIQPEELDMTYPNRLIKKLTDERDIPYVDLYDSFIASQKQTFFHIDEHLTSEGHALIAKVINDDLLNNSSPYRVISNGWHNERYPSLLKDNGTILFQSCTEDNIYEITLADTVFHFKYVLIKSREELIHPSISCDNRYLIFTQGDQTQNRTNVHLFDMMLGESMVITPDSTFSSIPSFSPNGDIVAMPIWNADEIQQPQISLFDLRNKNKKINTINSDKECWRPIFSPDNRFVFYIEKEKHFVIKRYDMTLQQSTTFFEADYDIWDIAVSPTGKYMSFAGNKDGSWNLYLFDFRNDTTKQLTCSNANEWDPSFGIDDNDLLFAVESGFFNGICRMRIPE